MFSLFCLLLSLISYLFIDVTKQIHFLFILYINSIPILMLSLFLSSGYIQLVLVVYI